MCVLFRQPGLKSLALGTLALGLTAQAQTPAQKRRELEPQAILSTQASKGKGGRSIVIAHPLDPDTSLSSPGKDLDTYLMPDELINQMDGKYYDRIRQFSAKQNFSLYSRDTRLQRHSVGTPREEQAMREEMASFMKRYMVRKGLPKYLSSKKETRFIGDQYQRAEKFVQTASRVEIKSKDESWKFGTGINPFTTKAWLKYSNPSSTIEIYNVFEKKDSLGISVFSQEGRYMPMADYRILQNSFSTGVKYRHSPMLNSEIRTSLPFHKRDHLWNHTVTSISSTYRF